MRSISHLSVSLLLSLPVPSASLGIHKADGEHEIFLKERTKLDDVIRHKLINPSPVGVRKLSDDEGEKFWLDYWQFVDHAAPIDHASGDGTSGSPDETQREFEGLGRNTSFIQAPFALHRHTAPQSHPRRLPRALAPLIKRAFECPVGSTPCTSIERPNSCCSDGTVCQLIKDTGLGDVGCCPGNTATCDGGIDTCPTDHLSCPDNPGGGCCIPGYSCFEEGCLSTVTVTVTPTNPAPTSTDIPPPTTTTEADSPTINPPWRPTSHPDTTSSPTASETPTTTEPPIPTDIGCPTGFYACSAHYAGGCCRTGRDCEPTSCPAPTVTTIVDSNGATVVVPVETGSSGPGEQTGTCAEGWKSCGVDDGGGCCPDGYGCGRASCTAEKGTGRVGKIQPENVGAGTGVEWRIAVLVWMVVVLWSLGW